ncbi:MAG: glutamate formimidoyltransferase [Erysipelotrichaceae bacterium]|nr:glutamate formimidoyltransferase [Erysipelotrichaceae bacterium]
MTKIVECVPNYSISEDTCGIEKIISPFKEIEGVELVNVEPDINYNRTVVTVIGEPEAVKRAMVQSCKIASEVIDMTKHHGEHKRMGATDVVPFIPIQDMSIEETIALSEACAKEIYEACNIPVFLYNLSAKREQCKNLPDIRKGEFEGMKEKLQDPYWTPDFGYEVHPTAGVTAVGCRPLLVAYNIDLKTEDRKVAAAIARMIRYSNGGYRCIQAGPASLDDHVQVTMNVTDYHMTSVYRAYEAVKMEAKRFGVEVCGSEFIGLVSLDCIKDIAAYYLQKPSKDDVDLSMDEIIDVVVKNLQVHGFSKEKVIEYYVK